ncbi:MAG TPA: hypothetical protein VLM79_12785 [Kofleriaceae bacterium]|nr:hypothetical protein [Kofleriaceae bacterium]
MRVTIGVALCLLGGSAHAEVVVRPGVGFTAAQLEAAIRARGGPEDSKLDVEVSSSGPGRLALVMPAGRWEIALGVASGEAAARVVALHVIELWAGTAATADSAAVAAGEGVAAVKASEPDARARVRVAGGQVPGAEVRVAAPRGARAIDPAGVQAHYRVAVLGVGGFGLRTRDFELVGGAIEVTRADRWLVGAGLGWQRGLTISHGPGPPIAADLVRVHVDGGVAVGAAELRAGGFAGRVVVDAGDGTISRWTTGLEASARVALPVSDAWAMVLAAGGELFRERIEVRFGSLRVGATPRTTLCGGIGLAWTAERAR